jgi:hypothetical protein
MEDDMRNAFLDPVTRVLKAHGFVNSNDPGDIVIPVDDDFDLTPLAWMHNGVDWVQVD